MGYVALKCPSFANRDSEAVFSEIFSCSIFDKLRIEVLCGGESHDKHYPLESEGESETHGKDKPVI